MKRTPSSWRTVGFTGVLAVAVMAAACADQSVPTAATADADLAKNGNGRMMSDRSGTLYVANLHPLNARAQTALDPDKERPDVAHGKAYFRIENGTLKAVVDAKGVEPNMIHPQHIHAADRCPPMSADTNRDGFIDVVEGIPFYGAILIPLDQELANLSFQVSFPMPEDNTYHYEETAQVSALLAALNIETLALSTRHVVIHGVDPMTDLPESVQTLPGPDGKPIPAYLTLPVACGEIRQHS